MIMNTLINMRGKWQGSLLGQGWLG